MMGPTKLKTIRRQLEAALATTGKDPIRWLEDRVRQLDKQRQAAPAERQLLEALVRILAGARKPKPPSARPRSQSQR